MKISTALPVAVAALLVSAAAMAGFINFEDAPTLGLSDNEQITTQYFPTLGITF